MDIILRQFVPSQIVILQYIVSYTRQEISNFVLSTDFTSKSEHPVCQDIQLNHCIPNKNTEITMDPGL